MGADLGNAFYNSIYGQAATPKRPLINEQLPGILCFPQHVADVLRGRNRPIFNFWPGTLFLIGFEAGIEFSMKNNADS